MVDADLSLRGNVKAPTLGGTVTVKSALWNRRDRHARQHLRFRVAAVGGRAGGAGGAEPAPTVPLRFDIQLLVPSTLRVENNLGAAGRQRRPDAARHLRSAGARSATPTSSAAR